MADICTLKKLPPLYLYAFQNYHPGRCLLASSIGPSKMFIEFRSFSHLMPLVSFYTLWKYQKTSVSLIVFTFSFSIRVFFRRHWRFTGQQGKGGDHLLFHSTTSTHPRTLWYLFATLRARRLLRILQIATLVFIRLLLDDEIYHLIELPFDWQIDDAMSLFTWWIDSRFLLQQFDMGNRWIWTRIGYDPCITS